MKKFSDFLGQMDFFVPYTDEGEKRFSLWSLTTEYTDCRDVLAPDAGTRKVLVSHCRHYAMTLEIRRAKKRTSSNRQLSVMAMTVGK